MKISREKYFVVEDLGQSVNHIGTMQTSFLEFYLRESTNFRCDQHRASFALSLVFVRRYSLLAKMQTNA